MKSERKLVQAVKEAPHTAKWNRFQLSTSKKWFNLVKSLPKLNAKKYKSVFKENHESQMEETNNCEDQWT